MSGEAFTAAVARGDDGADQVDLATQLEDLLHTVWEAEENWRFDDRLELSTRTRRGGRDHTP